MPSRYYLLVIAIVALILGLAIVARGEEQPSNFRESTERYCRWRFPDDDGLRELCNQAQYSAWRATTERMDAMPAERRPVDFLLLTCLREWTVGASPERNGDFVTALECHDRVLGAWATVTPE